MSKLPLAVRKSIRDDFDPYVPTFEKGMEDLLGMKWTLEMPWAECLETAVEFSGFKENPGKSAASYFEAIVTQLKGITKDGKDDMIVEGINEACDKHIVTIILDEKINSWSDCRVVDGKLCIVFMPKDNFGAGAKDTLKNLISQL